MKYVLRVFDTNGAVQTLHVESDSTTAAASLARARGLRVTRLARGVPIGSELEYVDLGTIAHALSERR